MRAWQILSSTVLLPVILGAQEPRTAADVTGVGRGMDRPLDIFLGSSRSGQAEERQLFILLDSNTALAGTNFLGSLTAALDKNRQDLSMTQIGVAQVGAKPLVLLEPSLDRRALLEATSEALRSPRDEILNVYRDLRSLAKSLAGKSGTREILLLTLTNGDAEDDLPATASRLSKAGIKLSVIASEAYLSDSYWAKRRYQDAPKDCRLMGPDSAYIEVPWSWLFQREPINEVTPAGYAFYGLNRMVAATGGRSYIYTPASTASHRCSVYNSCLICSGDHISPGELYKNAALEPLAPLVLPRKEVAGLLASDPYYRATNKLWQAAARAGLITGTPPLKVNRTSAQPQAARGSNNLGLTGISFSSQAKTADKAANQAKKLIVGFERDLSRIGPGKGIPRQEAVAELSRIMLRLTQINLMSYAAFCRGIGPELADPDAKTPSPPEVAGLRHGMRPRGVMAMSMPLCHGVSPYLSLEIPGSAELAPKLREMDILMQAFLDRYRNTPFTIALHRAGIAKFQFTYPGVAGRSQRRRPGSATDGTGPATGAARPNRRTGSSGTGSSGPSTGRRR